MSGRGGEAAVCPRCGGVVEFYNNAAMKPHRDNAVLAPCPMGGLTLREAGDRIDAERAKVGLPPVVVKR